MSLTQEPRLHPAPLDPRSPLSRLRRLLDRDSVLALHAPDDSGALAVTGTVAGRPVVAYATDPTVKGGALGAAGCRHIVGAITEAVARRVPVVGLWQSGGARLADGVASLDGVGRIFAAMTAASGQIPQLSVVLGPAAGAAAYGPALTDIIVTTAEARMFVTGPEVIRQVTGEDIEMEALGGPQVHDRKSGVAHVHAGTEAEAYVRTRAIITLLGDPGVFDLDTVPRHGDLREVLPASSRSAYNVKDLIGAVLDPTGFEELQPRWAPNVVIGFGRLAGHTVGVVGNNPLRKGGCLDALGAEKAARFVRLCDSLGVPLLVLVDVPGYLPGVEQEWAGVIRRGAKLLHAFAEARVPRVSLITRKAYGGAFIAMNSRALGATAVLAWPDAEVAVMGADAAVGVLHRRRLSAAPADDREALRAELVEQHRATAGGVQRAVALGVVDEVIDPALTRGCLARTLATAPARRGSHTNIPL
ncbi:acyl-CoA carboxylase subunit beta [Actinoplanes sp. NPDC049599]|uniref:acyl-CoA carboxylase subunit beta n=1 Tax=Actinoplanes sp. NPDC049599 TaxID=3363903 RepID=UPI00379C7498